MNQQVAVRPGNPGYSPEAKADILQHILNEVATGRSVKRILREDEGMCDNSTFWKWCFDDPEYSDQLARARAAGQDAILDEVIDIIDDATDDAYIDYIGKGEDKTPVAKIDGRAIARARLQAEYRLKQAQMLSPKKYGQKLDLTSGGEQLKPTQLTDNRVQALVGLAVERKLKQMKPEEDEG